MSIIPATEQAAITKEEGKLKKLFAAVKKFLSKEFLWVLFALVLALPIALIIVYFIEKYVRGENLLLLNKLLDGKPLFSVGYLIGIAGIYFTRSVVGAIKTLVK